MSTNLYRATACSLIAATHASKIGVSFSTASLGGNMGIARKIDPNLLFFGNLVDGSSRLNDLEQFREHMEAFLRREQTYFVEEAHPDLELEFLPLFAETFPPILHSSVVISTAILLEQEMRGFSGALIDALGLKLKFNDLSGSVLERFRTLVVKVASLDLNPNQVPWDDMVGLFEIRNCLGGCQDFCVRGLP